MAVNRKEQEIIQSVVVLTQDDKLTWNYDAQGFYFAMLEDMELKFQACCTPQAPSFFINGIRFYLGDNAVMELCNEIAIQAQRYCRNIDKLDELNERLKIIAFPKKETA